MTRTIVLFALSLAFAAEVFAQTITVGTWNLEHFGEGKKRGFPEFRGNQAIAARTDADYANIARIIHELNVGVLAVQEINARQANLFWDDVAGDYVEVPQAEVDAAADGDFEVWQVSDELQKVVGLLKTNYRRNFQYVVAAAGHSQRVAFLWDTDRVEQVQYCETSFPNPHVQNKGLFDRQPLVGEFRFLNGNGTAMNDLVVVNVHLASGQQHGRNHREAMRQIRRQIMEWREQDACIRSDEHDVLIVGDYNANRFGGAKEFFWDDMEGNGQTTLGDEGRWDVLANDSNTYLATRLSGNPPAQRTSVIDYIIATRDQSGFLGMNARPGLVGQEIDSSISEATIHSELVNTAGGGMAFRAAASDHLPVTVDVAVMEDRD